MKEIKFYRSGDNYGWMSNFARFPVEVDGEDWPTSEHYYQAQKYTDPELQVKVQRAHGPGAAKRIGSEHPCRPDWDEIKDDVMRKVVYAKFIQHPELGYELIATGDAILIEHTKNDNYWGDGGDGKGKNMLGVILMEVREQIKGQYSWHANKMKKE